MIAMNRIIPIIGVIVLVIALAVALKSGERAPRPDMLTSLPTAASPDVDTPADTVRSLSAQVAELISQTRRLTEENQRLREQHAAALDQERRVTDRVRAELAGDIERAGRRDERHADRAVAATGETAQPGRTERTAPAHGPATRRHAGRFRLRRW
jgi:hypothetical protein